MKRFICILLALALFALALTGCDRRSETPEGEVAESDFAPETTAVGGLTQAVESQEDVQGEELPGDDWQELDGEDAALENAGASPDPAASSGPTPDSPFASPTPQPNASVSQYTEVSAPGLGFRFSYPSNWVNIPGRFTVCYVQPLEEGTVYPARVAVTMKRMLHRVSKSEVRTQFGNYVKQLMSQYDESTFKVNTKLNSKVKFMGRNALSTTYLAYDGRQEIKGYVIITYFDRYLYVFHFLCAYNDYPSFEATIRYMRDSVQADASVAPD